MRDALTGLIFVAGHEPPQAPVLLIVQRASRMAIRRSVVPIIPSVVFAPLTLLHGCIKRSADQCKVEVLVRGWLIVEDDTLPLGGAFQQAERVLGTFAIIAYRGEQG